MDHNLKTSPINVVGYVQDHYVTECAFNVSCTGPKGANYDLLSVLSKFGGFNFTLLQAESFHSAFTAISNSTADMLLNLISTTNYISSVNNQSYTEVPQLGPPILYPKYIFVTGFERTRFSNKYWFFSPFKPAVWALIMLILILITFLFLCVAQYKYGMKKILSVLLATSMESFGVMLATINPSPLIERSTARGTILSFSLLSFAFLTFYNALLFTALTNARSEPLTGRKILEDVAQGIRQIIYGCPILNSEECKNNFISQLLIRINFEDQHLTKQIAQNSKRKCLCQL